jgi:hypothetical protein
MKAPIALFVYKRLSHLQQCVEALKKNQYADQSDLIIFSDGTKNESDDPAVKAVRDFLPTITGFRSVHVVAHDQNLGLSASILKGVTDVVGKYGKVIVMEDDLIASRYFLKFMNDGLDTFENDDRVISIHGYLYPVKAELPSYFFLRGADCWGWATWKRGWDLLETDGKALLKELTESGETKRFNFNNSYPYLQMLEDRIVGKNNSWAILWYASAFLKNKLTLYPGISLVQNIGNDNSGTHSKQTDKYDVQMRNTAIIVDSKQPLQDSKAAVTAIADYFSVRHSIKTLIKGLFKKL